MDQPTPPVEPQPSVRLVTAAAPSTFSRSTRVRRAAGDFLRRVYKKAEQDQIFFMAGAIAFNVLVAIIPLALAAVGVAGFILQARSDAPAITERVVDYLMQSLAIPSAQFREDMRANINRIVESASGLFTVSSLIFAWLATRLVGTLRSALREIFDIEQDRSIIAGKFFDLQMVFIAGTLLAVNISITIAVEVMARRGLEYLNIETGQSDFARNFLLTGLAFLTIWFLFVLIYRYLPFRRIHWSTAITAATFTALVFELMKAAFAWYFANYATYSAYGQLANIAIVIIWVYYAAIAFILGGEVGQVAALKRIRRQQKERLN